MTTIVDIIARLAGGFYNSRPYADPGNRGGLAERHDITFPAALADTGAVAQHVGTLAEQVAIDAGQVATDKATVTAATTTVTTKAGEAVAAAEAAQQAAANAATVTAGKADGDLGNVTTANFAAKAAASGVGGLTAATQAEVDAGTSATKAVTPLTLANRLASPAAVYAAVKAIVIGGAEVTVAHNDAAKTLIISSIYSYDPLWPYVTALLQPLAGAGSYATDATGKAITYGGNAALTASAAVTGGAGFTFDGAGDYLSLPAGSGFDFGSKNFSIEMLFSLAVLGAPQALFASQADFKLGAFVTSSNRIGYFVSGNGTSWNLMSGDTSPFNGVGATTLSANTIYYLCLSRAGTTWEARINGVLDMSATVSGAVVTRAEAFNVGRWGAGGYWLNGKVYAVRITLDATRASAIPTALWPTH